MAAVASSTLGAIWHGRDVDQIVERDVSERARVMERELRLVREAVAAVASDVSPRVTVAGLRLGEPLLGPARQLAAQAGVRVVPLWRVDEAGVDIAIERAGDDES
jgi:hypothetical protein